MINPANVTLLVGILTLKNKFMSRVRFCRDILQMYSEK